MSREVRLIDQIMTEITDKNLLNEVCQITLTKTSLVELKADYSDEFKMELLEMGREASVRDIEDYFGVPIVVSTLKDDKKYQLLKKV